MIIGIAGTIGSGKDTIADHLVSQHGFVRLSFAGPLKDAVSSIFGWDRNALEGITPESREWREQVDTWWADNLGIPHLTPRWVLQNIGTDVMRTHFHSDIWVYSVMRQATKCLRPVVISDCRFMNEARILSEQGGHVWRVMRGRPDWWSMAQQAAIGDRAFEGMLKSRGVHASEWNVAAIAPTAEIDNTGTLEQLYSEVDNLISTIKAIAGECPRETERIRRH